tara:strand:+ start:531 stop:746 length:216 start_codon:yes stop_codon:yes gene_type:complete
LPDSRHNDANRLSALPKPTTQEIEGFYRDWWLNTYQTPLHRTPMGIAEFADAFYDQFCASDQEEQNPGLTD